MHAILNHMQDTLLPSEYQSLTQSTTPEIDLSFLEPLLWTSALLTILFAFFFLLYATYTIVRRHKVEKATLEMRDDIRRMRELMEQGSSPIKHDSTPQTPQPQASLPNQTSDIRTKSNT